MAANDRTPEERAQAAAFAELAPRAQRVARAYLRLEGWERDLLVGPHLPGYPYRVARVMRQLDALTDAEWAPLGRYLRTVYASLEADR